MLPENADEDEDEDKESDEEDTKEQWRNLDEFTAEAAVCFSDSELRVVREELRKEKEAVVHTDDTTHAMLATCVAWLMMLSSFLSTQKR